MSDVRLRWKPLFPEKPLGLKTVARYPLERVLPFTTEDHSYIRNYWADGKIYRVKMHSLRYDTFLKSNVCTCCGLRGRYMALQHRHDTDPVHFNLYGISKNGHPILMTKDHILPRSRGGGDHIDNMQTMCHDCNALKQNWPLTIEQLRVLKEYRNGLHHLKPKQRTELVRAKIKELLGEEQYVKAIFRPKVTRRRK